LDRLNKRMVNLKYLFFITHPDEKNEYKPAEGRMNSIVQGISSKPHCLISGNRKGSTVTNCDPIRWIWFILYSSLAEELDILVIRKSSWH
jgi:hypothetical protein